MSEAEQFERTHLGTGEDLRLQAGRNDLGRNDFGRNGNGHDESEWHDPRSRQSVPEHLPRAVGSPLPMALPGNPRSPRAFLKESWAGALRLPRAAL